MFLLYAPAFLTGLATFWLFPHGDLGFRFLKSAITIHFFKRILEFDHDLRTTTHTGTSRAIN
ncbi:hypothetical protein QQP08_004999 [Theobroma cacao]|nr:hypothetical protein QQP08_004999 [Theobroma cacao]